MNRGALQSGFSLLELIVVVVLVGILATGAGMLIVNPITAYDDQQLVDQGEMALRQIANDVRRALPNSLRLATLGSGWSLRAISIRIRTRWAAATKSSNLRLLILILTCSAPLAGWLRFRRVSVW